MTAHVRILGEVDEKVRPLLANAAIKASALCHVEVPTVVVSADGVPFVDAEPVMPGDVPRINVSLGRGEGQLNEDEVAALMVRSLADVDGPRQRLGWRWEVGRFLLGYGAFGAILVISMMAAAGGGR